MRLLQVVSLILALATVTLADIEFLDPNAGSVAKGGDVLTVRWKDSGKSPKLSELTHYDLFLCAGGDSENSYEELTLLIKEGAFSRGNSVSFQVNNTVGGSDQNAYFLKMVSSGPDVPIVINYSKRFSLTRMSGTFSSRVQEGISSISNSDELAGSGGDHDELKKRQNEFTIPYQDQLTGLTRYAPMPEQPGTTIIAQSASRQFPTSPVLIATAFLPPPTFQTTIAASLTFSTISIENTASPASMPVQNR